MLSNDGKEHHCDKLTLLFQLHYHYTVFDEVYSHLYCFIAGDHLEVCPHGSTCCTRDMEGKLKALSAREYSNIIGDAFRYAKNTFITRTRKFDGK